MTDPYEIVERHWPYDGPHSDDTIADAVTAVERLTRYAANATWRRPDTGQGLWRIVSGLSAAVSHLDQVLDQLTGAAAGRIADDASLYDDRHDRPGADTAVEVAILLKTGRQVLAKAAASLSAASNAASHLGNDEVTAEAARRG